MNDGREELVPAYVRTRDRCCGVLRETPAEDYLRVVPACPAWRVRDLVAHVVAMPVALAVGRLPTGDVGEWLEELIRERDAQPVPELLAEWQSIDAVLGPLLNGPAALLFADLAVHEHDLRGAVGRPDHAALETDVVMPRTLAAFRQPLLEAGLGAIVVQDADREWRSSDAPAGWTLHVDAWTAVRAVNSRRTAAELRALPGEGDVEPYLPVLDAHLPLPHQSLHE